MACGPSGDGHIGYALEFLRAGRDVLSTMVVGDAVTVPSRCQSAAQAPAFFKDFQRKSLMALNQRPGACETRDPRTYNGNTR